MNQSMIFVLAFIILIIKRVLCLEYNVHPIEMASDFTLHDIDNAYHHISFTIPTIKLYFGTPNNQCLHLAIHTSSIESIIEGSYNLNQKFKHQFDKRISSSFDNFSNKCTVSLPLLSCPLYRVTGEVVKDSLSLPDKEILDNKFSFILLDGRSQFPTLNIDGYLGMPKHYYRERPNNNLLLLLYKEQKIKNLIFGLNYNKEGGGTIIFGESERYANYTTCSSNNVLISKYHWFCSLTNVSIGELEFIIKDQHCIFDVAKNSIIVPNKYGLRILNFIISISKNHCELISVTHYFFLKCNENTQINIFPELHIQMEQTVLIIDWLSLMKPVSLNNTMSFISLLLVQETEDSEWTIGLPGIIDNSIFFDGENSRIGIKSNVKKRQNDSKLKVIYYVLFGFLIIMIGGIVLMSLIKFKLYYNSI